MSLRLKLNLRCWSSVRGSTWPINLMLLCVFAVLLSSCGSREQNAQKYYESGMVLIEKKDDLGARLELLNAVKYDQNKVEVWRALSGIDERTGANSLFIDLRRIVELDSKDQETRLRLAKMMFDGRAIELALKTIDATPTDQTQSAGIHALRAAILVRLNDGNGAVREAQKAAEIDSTNIEAAIILAADKAAKAQNDDALKILEKLPIEAANDTRVRLVKVQILERKGDLQKAELELKELVKSNPKQVEFQNSLVQLYIFQRRLDDAEAQIRQIADTNPTDTKLGMNVVRFLATARDATAARTELERLVKQGGDIFPYQLALAEMAFTQGKPGESKEALEKLISSADSTEKRVEAQIKLAEVDLATKDMPAAEKVITTIIQADRRNTRALALRASLNIDKGRIDDAITDLREALNDQPKSPQLLLLLATAYERNGQNELADRQYGDALKTTGLNPAVVKQYIIFLRRRDDMARADDVLVEAANRNPRNVEILAMLAQLRLLRQNYAGALELADRIASLGEDRTGVADQIRGAAFSGQNKPEESIAAFERVRAASPNSLQPIVPLVAAYLRANKADQAESLLKVVLEKNPENADVLVLLGQAQQLKNKPEEAIKSFKSAIALQPNNMIAYGTLSDLYISQKKYDEAYDVMRSALREQPNNLNYRLAVAGLLDTKGDHEGAIAAYEALYKEQSNSVVVINNLASLLLDNRSDKPSIDRAIALADKLRDTKVPQYLDTLGAAQYQQGDYKRAIASLEMAKSKLPELAAIRYHLGMAYRADGQMEKAAEELKKAAELEPTKSALNAKIQAVLAELR